MPRHDRARSTLATGHIFARRVGRNSNDQAVGHVAATWLAQQHARFALRRAMSEGRSALDRAEIMRLHEQLSEFAADWRRLVAADGPPDTKSEGEA